MRWMRLGALIRGDIELRLLAALVLCGVVATVFFPTLANVAVLASVVVLLAVRVRIHLRRRREVAEVAAEEEV